MNISIKLIIFGILFVCITSVGIQQSFAQSSSEEPVNYDIRIKVVDIGNIDLGTGSFEMVFWTILSSNGTDFNDTPPPKLDYVNAKEYTVISNRTSEYEYRAKISGIFFVDDLNFKLYPHMEMKMGIDIESAGQQIDQIKFKVHKDAKKNQVG